LSTGMHGVMQTECLHVTCTAMWACRPWSSRSAHTVFVAIARQPLPFGGEEEHLGRWCMVDRLSVLPRQVDTRDILFIVGGAFVDLDRQVAAVCFDPIR
jgi:hypothetical protein